MVVSASNANFGAPRLTLDRLEGNAAQQVDTPRPGGGDRPQAGSVSGAGAPFQPPQILKPQHLAVLMVRPL